MMDLKKQMRANSMARKIVAGTIATTMPDDQMRFEIKVLAMDIYALMHGGEVCNYDVIH